jgi:outer membrane protein TolC
MRLRTILLGTLLAAGAFAQVSSFPKPGYFREAFARAQSHVELKDPVKLRDFVAGGKLELSLKHYLELVMANNTDIQIQFLSLEIPRNNILAAFGPFDPTTRTSFLTTRNTQFVTSQAGSLDSGSFGSSTKSLSQPYSLNYTQLLPSGTQYAVTFNGQRSSSSPVLMNTFNPNLQTDALQLSITQPLLRNRGTYVNRLPIMQAQSNLKVSEYNLRTQLLTLVNNAETAYWNAVSARETLRVQEQARDTAAEYLKFMQQQLDLGALSPLDIYNPKASLAAAEVSVSQARFALAQAEDALRHQIGADLDQDARKLAIVLTEPADPGPTDSMVVDREQEVAKAISINPAMKSAAQRLDVDDLGIQSARNGLLPNLSFTASYTSSGRGGSLIPAVGKLNADGTPFLDKNNNPVYIPGPALGGGLGDSLGQMFGFSYPTYQAGLTLTLPIRSRTAAAAMGIALAQKKMDSLNLRNQQQNIRLQILNAVTNLDGAREQLKLAIITRDFAKLNLDAENQKYQLGTEINQNVINAQQQLASAELTVVNAQISLRKSLLNLITQTGELLDERGIVVQ